MKLCAEDQKIYELCKKYGAEALEARRKFAGLLPEVFRRRIYLKKGYGSIFEFAARLAGISQEQVRMVLNLEKRLEDKPVLKNLLIGGEVSVNKLARVVAVATSENQEFLADQLKLLSQAAVETLVRDIKVAENVNDLQKPIFEDKSLRAQTQLRLNEIVAGELLELQEKGIDINQLIANALQRRREEIAEEKGTIAETVVTQGRYIPVKIKNILIKEQGTKCSIQDCKKAAEEIHHTQRFAIGGNHDPHFMARVCSEHHKIAHSIDVKFQQVKVRAR